MQQAIPINPEILRWARIEAGFSLSDAVHFADIGSPRQKKGEPKLLPEARLDGWESGKDAPSLNQLEQLAKAYRRPVITFFLQEPPEKIGTGADYRTVGDRDSRKDRPEFSALRRRLAMLHQELCTLAKSDGSQKLPFIGSLSEDTPVTEFVDNMRSVLKVSMEQQFTVRDENALLKCLRVAAQNAGIYVLFAGDLGSHHSRIAPEDFRGIALADELAPMVVVNPNDAKAAQVFTLVHELVHLWLGSSGVSNTDVFGNGAINSNKEKFCNSIAAEFLVPESVLREEWDISDGTLQSTVDALAKVFKVSGAVIGRRLLDLKIINSSDYGDLYAFYRARWESQKERQKEIQEPDSSGPSRTMMDKYRLGDKTIHTLIGAAQDGRIGTLDAARLMNIPVSRFDKVMQ